MKVAIGITRTLKPFGEDYRASCLRENLTSSSYGEGLETGREFAQEPRQSFTRQLSFRWFKCILKCKHFLSLSENGLAIQVYCAIIASLLISLWSGRKPDKRTYEMLCLHMQGWASDKELEEHLKSLKEAEKKKIS